MNDPNSWKNLAYCNPARNDEGESNVDWCHGVRQGSATGSTLPLYLMSPQAATTSAKNALNGMGTNLGISPFGWSSESYAHSSMPPLPSTIISTTMITNASNERKEVTLDGEEEEAASKKSKDNLEKKGSKKRKTQQMFSVDIPGTESQSFGTKTTGEAKLTTNTPREIEVRTPNDGILIHVYKSCSECARSLNVNRSKLSRVCRSGGGLIGRFHYQYVAIGVGMNASQSITGEESNVVPQSNKVEESNVGHQLAKMEESIAGLPQLTKLEISNAPQVNADGSESRMLTPEQVRL